MDKIIEIKDLSFQIKNKTILKNISFHIEKGEVVGLLGVNGCGKTTLLKCLNRINEISSGDIFIDKQNLNTLKQNEIAKKIGYMGQNTFLNIDFNCLDIVVMGRYPFLEKGKHFSKGDYEKAKKYMKETDTIKFMDKSINKLSGGERQRVLFTKVLTQETDIILLDEPSASMDISNQEDLFKICKELKKSGKGIVISIHDLRIASKYCDKLILLKDGKQISYGTVEEVLTSENIEKTYGIKVKVYKNEVSKILDYHIL